MDGTHIMIGGCYSNGDFGKHWAVRQVLDIREGHCGTGTEKNVCVRYKVLVGPDRRKTFTCTQHDFAEWAKYEVTRNENVWERAD